MKKSLLLSIALVLTGFNSFAQWEWQNPIPTVYSLLSVHFTDANTGYAVGDAGTILKTIDGGATWISQTSGTTLPLNSIYFPDADTGFAVGNDGTILKTTNGGGPAIGIIEPPRQTNNSLYSLKIYPNPATEYITIEPSEPGSNMNGTVSIYGMTGREVIRQQIQGSKTDINVSSLQKSVYVIRLMNNEKTAFGKFIKE